MNTTLSFLKEFLRNNTSCPALVKRIAEDSFVQDESLQNAVTVDQLKDFFRCIQNGMEYARAQPWGDAALPDALIIKSLFCVQGKKSHEVFYAHREQGEFQLWISHFTIARIVDHSTRRGLERIQNILHLLFSARDALTLKIVSQCFLISQLRAAKLFTEAEHLRIMQSAIQTLRIRPTHD